jgi:hypothetical protein
VNRLDRLCLRHPLARFLSDDGTVPLKLVGPNGLYVPLFILGFHYSSCNQMCDVI